MDYQISVAENLSYIVIKIFTPMTTELSLRMGPEIIHLAKENNINKFLFDVRKAANIQSVTENYYFAYQDINKFGFPRGSLSAFLVDKNDKSHDFITTAFLNAGYLVKQFDNENSAINWLEKSRL